MSFSVSINGDDYTFDATKDSLTLNERANSRATLELAILSETPEELPELDSLVVLYEDGTPVFGGPIDRAPIQRFAGELMETVISAVSFEAFAERRIIQGGGIPAGWTLKQILTELQPWWVAAWGVTLDTAQVDGPTFPELLYDDVTLLSAYQDLAKLSANYGEPFVFQVSPAGVLSMFQPSTVPAPFDIIGDRSEHLIGDVTVEPTREGFANRIIVKVAPKTEIGRVESFTGDGSATVFTLLYTPTATRGGVFEDDGVNPPVFRTVREFGDPATYTLDRAARTLTRAATHPDGTTAGPLPSGVVMSITFDGVYSGRAYADAPGVLTNPWERVVVLDDVPTGTTLQAKAEALVAESSRIPKKIGYPTDGVGLRVGMSQTMTVPMRGLDETVIVTDLSTRAVGPFLVRQVGALASAQSNLGRGWQDTVEAMFDSGSGGGGVSVVVGPGGGVSTGPNGPDMAVQSNRAGFFYGKSTFLFLADQNSLVCGDGSAVTASLADSCGAFGSNCHVSD